MDNLEIIMFKEINNYSEKFYGLTFRQWIFSALAVLVVVPTYILLPKYVGISADIASYIVIFEAGIIGFIGFVKINDQPAEALLPYLYRHFTIFGKPIKYMTDKEYAEAHDKKSKKAKSGNKKAQNKTEQITIVKEKEPVKQINVGMNKTIASQSKVVNKPVESVVQPKPSLSKKELKKKAKQEKMLEKAKKKYGYILDDKNPVKSPDINNQVNNIVSKKPIEEDNNVVFEDKIISNSEVENKGETTFDNKEVVSSEKSSEIIEESISDTKEKTEDKKEETAVSETTENNTENVLNSLTPEQKDALLKVLLNDKK